MGWRWIRLNVGPCTENCPPTARELHVQVADYGNGLAVSPTRMGVCVWFEAGCFHTKMARNLSNGNCRLCGGSSRHDRIFSLGESRSALDGCRRLRGPDQEEERREQPNASSDVRQNAGPCAIPPAAALFHLTRHGLIMHRKTGRCLGLFIVRTNRGSLLTDATAPAAQIEAHLWHRRNGQPFGTYHRNDRNRVIQN